MPDSDRKPTDVLRRFAAAVHADPDRVAVRGGDRALTFADLDAASAGLAAALVARGIGRGERVGVSLARGARLVVALLAVWRAGAAYVPLDPSHPRERLEFMAEDAGIRALIATEGSGFRPADVECLDADKTPAAHERVGLPGDSLSPLDLAYVMFTSGSTGRPKAVAVTRGGVASLLSALEEFGAYEREPRVVAWNASAAFDASVQQWARVCRGDTIVVLDEEDRKDPERLKALIDRWSVTDLDLTPSHWQLLRSTLLSRRPEGAPLRLFMGGEPVSEHTWQEITAARDAVEGLNLYGPTECTVDSTAAWIAGGSPTIGGALPRGDVFVLDETLCAVPAGTAGELYIGGSRVALGYLNRPGLTAGRFVANPFGEPGSRLYRTGDVVRAAADGTLEFLGRSDRQVKFRGYRIELGEIEGVLTGHPEVLGAVALIRSEEVSGERLAAYCVPAEGMAPTAEALREHAAASLPDFMVPTDFAVIEQLPLTVNGKLDVAALIAAARPSQGPDTQAGTLPESASERLLAEVWSEVLGRPSLSVDDDFFALGGHSLLALRAVGRLKRQLGVSIAVKDVYRYPRLGDLAGYVEELGQAGAAPVEAATA
ncbi:non-ribosomal peptide synthetase [Actinospica sp. MGRD01-02]|uniref:Non-ribosomal peptide synthetase n=1 Tax=Actinospica acidithermotolerans TaxID=2828514 RepID=A0A941IJA1_9ACTN|nr:non-ribosomal peptide synthetase [Actinospica acidithermotolerans]MBR7826933.1 non-ribosomal peptide synthetase [Actinospica acidithermotolerans]